MQSIECEKMDQWREDKGQQDREKTASRLGVSSLSWTDTQYPEECPIYCHLLAGNRYTPPPSLQSPAAIPDGGGGPCEEPNGARSQCVV